MSESLRRSSRRSKKISFKVGDVVEITKSGVIVRGRLTSQVDSTQSNQPRWRITYDDDVFGDEELSESSLGHILTGSSDTESPTQAPNPAPPQVQSPASAAAATAARKKNRKNGRFVKSSTTPSDPKAPEPTAVGSGGTSAAVDKKSVSFSTQETSDSSVVSSNNNTKKTSAREQRTARRNRGQPEIATSSEKDVVKAEKPPAPAPAPKKRPPPHTGGSGGGKSSKKAKANPDEEVVKVPMLTGTLYLYKGLRRRAEFVRKY